MTSDALWYLARGSGVVSLLLFTVVVALGIANRSGRPFAGMNRLAVASVHRSAVLLALVFLVVHVVALVFDPYAQLDLIDLVLPFGSGYRPFWVGLGTLALDLALAVAITSLLRERIGHRAWRAVHWLAYAMWPVALLHGIFSGSDRGTAWMLVIDVFCVVVVLAVAAGTHPVLNPAGARAKAPELVTSRREQR
ncbi:ferric reductase [Kineosporia sp. NBRC 101677]|uniref:ferric reductase-like transmembrane domain-containing protein n=1 Tax=Kineosporia sp. NBRC 101677 TaxID=3032197 RepID=UPI0024A4FC65|nr:ferric reductase-like transmembrane domain-containing protein [Kineosporia sp. NBRC 101677]GLY13567.1 ferric reductase [Kineosporia sp. NBRC 101677]